MDAAGGVALQSPRGRGILAATALASGMAFLDGTVVNVALPTLARQLGAGLSGLQWIVDAYLLTLSAFLLLGGSLGDLVGRRRVFLTGTVAFAATSVLCGLAPTLATLELARALQGAAAALLVPGSLAVLKSSVAAEDQDAAVGAWAGLSGVTTAAGPLVGGWLVEALSWRSIFFLNLPLALAAVWTGSRCLPPAGRPRRRPLDAPGAALAALGLGGVVYSLIEGPEHGWRARAILSGAVGVAAFVAFLAWERRAQAPMVPLALFRRRQLTAVNLTTLTLYFALASALFLVVLGLQHGLGYSPIRSSLFLLPLSVVMLVLSPAAGRLAHRIGYRTPLILGPVGAGAGLALVAELGFAQHAAAPLIAGVVVFGVALGFTVAPLTAAAMTSVDDSEAGIASAVNNAVARVAGLLGVATVPSLAGVSLSMTGEPFLRAIRGALLLTAAICVAGGLVSWAALPRRVKPRPRDGAVSARRGRYNPPSAT